MRGHFAGKVCIVTGAASGIGRALCGRLAADGAIAIVADLQAEAAETWASELRQRGGRAEAEAVDVRDAADVEALVAGVVQRHGRLDVLFNNAGVAITGEVHKLSLNDWHEVLDVNLWGVIHGCDAAYPRMVAQGHGHIVNTASILGILPTPLVAPYVASKHAVLGLSQSLRAEGADLGVRVSAICPGAVRTPLLEDSAAGVPEIAASVARLTSRAITPDTAAVTILRAVRRNRAIIIFPWSIVLVAAIQRYLPGLAGWLMRLAARRARRLVGRTATDPPE